MGMVDFTKAIIETPAAPIVWKALHDRREAASWTPAELGYMAGLLDGEGCFTLTTNKRTGTLKNNIRVAITNEAVTIWLVDHFGGGRSTVIWKAHPKSRPVDCVGYQWAAYGQEAVDIATVVLPYLVIKPDEAQLFIEAWATRQPQWGGGQGHHPPVATEIRTLRESYCQRLKDMRADKKARLYAVHPSSRSAR